MKLKFFPLFKDEGELIAGWGGGWVNQIPGWKSGIEGRVKGGSSGCAWMGFSVLARGGGEGGL